MWLLPADCIGGMILYCGQELPVMRERVQVDEGKERDKERKFLLAEIDSRWQSLTVDQSECMGNV